MLKQFDFVKYFRVLSLLLYLVACCLPIFKGDALGIQALFAGWQGILLNQLIFFVWFANVTFWIAMSMSIYYNRRAVFFSIASFLLGMLFLAIKEDYSREVINDERLLPGLAFYFGF